MEHPRYRSIVPTVASVPFCVPRFGRILLLDRAVGEHLVPGRTDFEIGLVPAALEGHARVQNGQKHDGQNNHQAFEDHKAHFLVGESAAEAFFELGDTVAGSDEDEQRGGKQRWITVSMDSDTRRGDCLPSRKALNLAVPRSTACAGSRAS